MDSLTQEDQVACLGVLCWEEAGCPRGLRQLEELVGNSTHPETFALPVRFARVPGANLQTVVLKPSPQVLLAMIESAQKLIDEGARAITTSCGFNAIFQRELAQQLDVPVLTSSLLQIPFIRSLLGENCQIAVITASAASLTNVHFEKVGVLNMQGIHVVGLEQNREWRKIFESPDDEIDIILFRQDLIDLSIELSTQSRVDAFVLECTDLPPFANDIRRATGRPVFDFVSLANFAQQGTIPADSELWPAPIATAMESCQ